MKPLRRAWKRLAGSLTGGTRERELADEFQSHVEMLTEDNIRAGMAPAEARRAAMLTFGGVEAAKENYRDQRGFPALDSLRQDVRYALRGMRRNPVFTAIAVTCLALGIGANTAIFSLVNAAMLRALPVSHPEQLVFFTYADKGGDLSAVRRSTTGFGQASFPYATYEAFRDRGRTLAGVFVYVPVGIASNGITLDVDGRPFAATGEMVTGNYFATLGVTPVLGRAIAESDLAPGAPSVTVISHKLWQREFGGLAGVVGRTIRVNGEPFTLIGVAPPEFSGLSGAAQDCWFPLRVSPAVRPWGSRPTAPEAYFGDRRWWWCNIGARLKPGATSQQVLSETQYLFTQSITAGVANAPARLPALAISDVNPMFQRLRKTLATPLVILLVTAGLMLLMACANVAALLMARAQARQKEIGVRLAIGASRARVVRQLLTESMMLAGCGGALGLLLAFWGAPALLRLIGLKESPLNVSPDGAVLAFAAAASVGTAILFGLAPALRAAREDLAPQLKGAATSVVPRSRLGKVLVALQVGLSVVLLFAAGLFMRTLRNLEGQQLGFERDNLLLFEVDPARSGYTGERAMGLHNQIAERIGKLPGVRSVSYVEEALLSGAFSSTPTATDGGIPIPAGRPDEDFYNRVGPRFFETMRMRMVLGRGIELRDTDGAHPAAVVNETWARTHFPNENPLGHRLTVGGGKFDPEKSYVIVGVVEDAKFYSIREAPPRTVYIAYGAKWDRVRRMCFTVRVAGSPAALSGAMAEAVRAVAPGLPVYNVRTQRQQIDAAMGTERTLASVSSFFGALALLLVGIGVYGTLSYAVTRRTGEIGIRMALGARRAAVLWLILRGSLGAAALGLCAGLPAALALSRYAESVLFGVGARDGVTVVATVVILAAIAAVSGLLPANRAARIDPIRALRHE